MQTQSPLISVSTYDYHYRQATAIIDASEAGIFLESALLIDSALRDARLRSTLSTRTSGLLGKPLEFDPGKDTAKGRKVAEDFEAVWPKMFEHSTLVQMLEWGIMQGVAVGQIIEDCDPWRVEIWHPWQLVWDPFARSYYLRTRETARLDLFQNPDGTFSDEQGGKWMLYLPFGYGNAGRHGAIRSVHSLVGEREWSHRDRSRYSEIFGQTIRFVTAPATSSKEERDEVRDRVVNGAQVIVGSQGVEGNRWDLKTVEGSGKSTELFHETIGQLDKEIATLLLGQSQSTDGQAGLGSNDKAGETVRLDIIRADADTLSDAIRAQVLVPYCQFAYGDGELAPWPCWDIEPAEDTQKKALEFKDLITGLVAAKAAGIPVDVRGVLEDYGIPMITEAEQAALEAANAAKAADALKAAQAQPVANGKNGAAPMPTKPTKEMSNV